VADGEDAVVAMDLDLPEEEVVGLGAEGAAAVL
jgi:hypothetical protein